MSSSGDFLGIIHEFGPNLECNEVFFWARDKLIEKALGLITYHRQRNSLTPGEASKLRGVLHFIARPAWHGVGKAALGPLRQRQYSDIPPWGLSHALVRAFEFIELILELRPRRIVNILPPRAPLVVVASDARADGAQLPTGGYLLIDCADGFRCAQYCTFSQRLLSSWGFNRDLVERGKQNPIANCEGAMPAMVFQLHAQRLSGRRVLFFLDNTASLHSYVKGCAGQAALDRSIAFCNFIAGQRSIGTWWEFVPSQANWADGISRLLADDPFAWKNNFPTSEMWVDDRIWQGTLEDAWNLARRPCALSASERAALGR